MPPDSPPGSLPFSSLRRSGAQLFLSGIIGTVEGVLPARFTDQTVAALTNLRRVLETEGATVRDVVDVTAFLTDLNQYEEFNEAYKRFFLQHTDDFPARTCIGVASLPFGASVELKVIACDCPPDLERPPPFGPGVDNDWIYGYPRSCWPN